MSAAVHYMGFITRRKDLSHEQFSHHWGTVHRDLVMEFARPGPIHRYVQDVGCDPLPDGFHNDFDGSPELWLPDQQALQELFAAERFQYAYHIDSPLFITMPAISFFVEDRVLLEGDSRGVKLMRLIPNSKDEAARERLQQGWNQPAPLGMSAVPNRLVHSTIVAAEAEGTEAADYLGIECSWWPDEQTAATSWLNREAGLTDGERVLMSRERIILEAV